MNGTLALLRGYGRTKCKLSPALESVGVVEQDRGQVDSIQGSVGGRGDAGQGQAGGEEVHDVGQLEIHLCEGEDFICDHNKVYFQRAVLLNL